MKVTVQQTSKPLKASLLICRILFWGSFIPLFAGKAEVLIITALAFVGGFVVKGLIWWNHA